MLERALGEASFSSLAATYFYAPRTDEGFLGAGLPEVMAALSIRPDVIDLAELERARALVSRMPLDPSELLEAPAKTLPTTRRVKMIRAFRLVELSHDAMSVFWQLEEGMAPLPPPMERVFALVWRSPRAVEHTALSVREAAVVEAASRGAGISALDAVAGRALARRVLDALSEGALLAA